MLDECPYERMKKKKEAVLSERVRGMTNEVRWVMGK